MLNTMKMLNPDSFLNRFGAVLDKNQSYVSEILQNEDLVLEFNCRGVKKADLEKLLEATTKVSEAFYNPAQPV